MNEPPKDYEAVLRTSQRDEFQESRLVLESMGIAAHVLHQEGTWVLAVRHQDAGIATAELDAYRRENPEPLASRNKAVPVFEGAGTAVFFYAGTIILVAQLNMRQTFGLEWFAAGRMRAGSVMDGQWWRTFTALTLHLDGGHIIANLLFGAVFGWLAGRVLGGGVAGLAIVIAGALGNFMNAAVQNPNHSSIGASTAVFAALGVIVSHSLRPRSFVQPKLLKRWSPLIGGVLLLAFTGIGGERTDVVAHLTGFLAGLLIGWGGCRLPSRWLESRKIQACVGLAALAIIAFAWALAFTHTELTPV